MKIINSTRKNKIIYSLGLFILLGMYYYYQHNQKILMNDFEQGVYDADSKGFIIELNKKKIILSFNTEETYWSVSKTYYTNREVLKKDSLRLNQKEFIFCIETISKMLNHDQEAEYLKMPEDSTKFMVKTLVTYDMSALAYQRNYEQIWYINIDNFSRDISPDFEKMLFSLIDKKDFYGFFEINR